VSSIENEKSETMNSKKANQAKLNNFFACSLPFTFSPFPIKPTTD